MEIYTNRNEFLNAVESGENTICLFENTEEPTDELAIQGLNSLARKSKRFNVAPTFLCKITEASGKSKFLYYYALECFFDEHLISYSISEFHCSKEQKVIATFGRLFHEVVEQNFILHNNEYDIYQLLYVYKSFMMFDDLSFIDFLDSTHFLECNHVADLMNY